MVVGKGCLVAECRAEPGPPEGSMETDTGCVDPQIQENCTFDHVALHVTCVDCYFGLSCSVWNLALDRAKNFEELFIESH
jgi:hypothetical protein